jgi:hypothetical protein
VDEAFSYSSIIVWFIASSIPSQTKHDSPKVKLTFASSSSIDLIEELGFANLRISEEEGRGSASSVPNTNESTLFGKVVKI